MKYSIVFLTYNEEQGIQATLDEAVQDLDAIGEAARAEIIVVDNASRDQTAAIVQVFSRAHPQVRLVRHSANLGYSTSTLTGFREAMGNIVVHVDGDGQLTLRDLPLFREKIEQGSDIVFGWRRRRQDPPIRIPLSFALNALSRLWLGWPYHDINIGYRAVTREVARAIHTVRPANFFGPELWVRARQHGWSVAEVPVQHFPRRGGQSIHEIRRLPGAVLNGLRYLSGLRRELESGGNKEKHRWPYARKNS